MQKHLKRRVLLDGLLLLTAAVLLVFMLLWPAACALSLTEEEARLMEAYENGEIIRLHVVAHSDSARDQRIKLAVRDAVLSAFGQELAQAGASSSEAAFQLLQTHRDEMERIAALTARSLGFNGSVEAQTGVLTLPQKQYGSVVLPAGRYRALRITLGDGQGRNWWCVLFPQLCLSLAGEPEPPQWMFPRILRLWPLASGRLLP